MPALLDAHHFLDLRFGLQHEVFRRASAKDEDARGEAAGFRVMGTIAAVWFTSRLTSNCSFESRSAIAGRRSCRMDESCPANCVKIGTPYW